MIAANEAVAALLEARKLPTLYRVHERPEPARVEHLVEQLAALDVPTPPLPEAMSPQQAGELVGEISRLVDEHVRRTGRGRAALTSLVLRSLKQAHYCAAQRRPLTACSRRATATSRRRSAAIPTWSATARCSRRSARARTRRAARAMDEAGEWCSLRERDAAAIERAADDVARASCSSAELFRARLGRASGRAR